MSHKVGAAMTDVRRQRWPLVGLVLLLVLLCHDVLMTMPTTAPPGNFSELRLFTRVTTAVSSLDRLQLDLPEPLNPSDCAVTQLAVTTERAGLARNSSPVAHPAYSFVSN